MRSTANTLEETDSGSFGKHRKGKSIAQKATATVVALASAFGALGFVSSAYVVSPKEVVYVTRLNGAIVQKTDIPGIHFKAPFIDKAHSFTLTLQQPDYKEMPLKTKDNQNSTGDFAVHWRLVDNADTDRAYNDYHDFSRIETTVNNINMSTINAQVGKVTLAHLSEDRDAVVEAIKKAINDQYKEAHYPFQVEKVIFNKLKFSHEAEDFLSATFKQSQDIITKGYAIQTAEKEAQRVAVEAEGKGKETRIKADAEAYHIKVVGDAKAHAAAAQAQAFSGSGGALVVKSQEVEKWSGNRALVEGGSTLNGTVSSLAELQAMRPAASLAASAPLRAPTR